MLVQAALEAQARLQGHEQRMADLQKEIDSAQRLMRSAQAQAREASDEKGSLTDKVRPVLCLHTTGAQHRSRAQHNMAQHNTAWHSMAQRGTAWQSMAQHGTAWQSSARHSAARLYNYFTTL